MRDNIAYKIGHFIGAIIAKLSSPTVVSLSHRITRSYESHTFYWNQLLIYLGVYAIIWHF